MGKKALIVIDVQNDYFPDGSLPLWNAQQTSDNIVNVIAKAKSQNMPIVLVQHVIDPAVAKTNFFVDGTHGVKIHADILNASPNAPVVIKRFADAFKETNLNDVLDSLGVDEILICGMQTQNCVGLTAISKDAAKYKTVVLADCCTAETKMVHAFAVAGFGNIVAMKDSSAALSQ